MKLLHAVARVALRVQPPIAARRTVERCAGWARSFERIEDARAAAQTLEKTGSCLSRSLAVAARLPGSFVVIGADPRWSSTFAAHAWVEWRDQVVDGANLEARGEPFARF